MRHTRLIAVLAALSALLLVATACQTTEPDEAEEDEMRLGYLLPETGPLAFLGPPMISAVEMAVEEINDAGGPLDREVVLIGADEAGNEAVASEAAGRLLSEGVSGIVGASASGMSLAVIDQVTGAEVVQCSPSNTSPTFTTYDDGGYYFRTAPTDALQGPVLAEVVLEEGHENVAILARADDYGRGLANAAAEGLEEGGATVVLNETYDPEASTFDAEVTQAEESGADAVILIAFDEGKQLIPALFEAGFGPDQLYGGDGIRSETLNEDIDPQDPNALDGFMGTAPSPEAVEGFLDRLNEFDPDLEESAFAPQAYDCAMLIALAAHAADSTDPTEFAGEIVGLTMGDNECTGFEECADLLDDGESIDYQFASGVDEFTDVGEPRSGIYAVWEWVDAELQTVDTRESSLEE